MSKKYNSVVITAPGFGTGKEIVGDFTGYDCGYCHGSGWVWNPEICREQEGIECPKCGGTGTVKATVVIEWKSDGNKKL